MRLSFRQLVDIGVFQMLLFLRLQNGVYHSQANINGGKLCILEKTEGNCISLPISGEGLFDSLYVGERLCIGQNINGGGARIVQIRLDDDFIVP